MANYPHANKKDWLPKYAKFDLLMLLQFCRIDVAYGDNCICVWLFIWKFSFRDSGDTDIRV